MPATRHRPTASVLQDSSHIVLLQLLQPPSEMLAAAPLSVCPAAAIESSGFDVVASAYVSNMDGLANPAFSHNPVTRVTTATNLAS